MEFIGQYRIMQQLRKILPDLYKYRNKGACMLFRAPSGYGKTTMAISCARYLSSGMSFQMYLADSKEFNFQKRVIFIDEVHKISDFEQLYPEMDKAIAPAGMFEKPHVFLFATNSDGNLPEAFTNRCYEFIFEDYTDEELLLIAINSSSFKAPEESFMKIIEAGNRNPRIIKSLCTRLSVYFSETPSVNSRETNFEELLQSFFGIENGLDGLARKYIEVLDDIGGRASLSLMKSLLHVDEGTLKNNVEPVLLRKGKIKITPKGRILEYGNL